MAEPFPDSIKSFEIDASDAGLKRPILAAEAGRIFARWANVELTLGNMVAVLVGDMGAMAVLDSIRARNSQMDAIRAIAAERIAHSETLALLKPVFSLIDRAAKPRNKLAHCVWGTIPQLPDALLLCEPKALLKVSRSTLQMDGTKTTEAPTETKISFEHGYNTSNDVALELIKTMRDGTEVWRQRDFDTPRALLDASIIALTQFAVAVSGDPMTQAAAQARAQLGNHLQKFETLR